MVSFSKKVYEVVTSIPRGKVATYSEVARMVGRPRAYRAVGNILHRNPNPKKIPCHRVVKMNGALTCSFAFGGIMAQKERLEKEGVCVRKNNTVNLGKYAITI